MNKQTKTMLLTITAAIAALPLAGFALAQTAPKAAPAMTQPLAQTQTKNATQEPMIKGSILLPAEQKGVEMTDAQESAQYLKLAKITLDQARAAAQAAVPGTVTSIKLDEEDGYLVYEVEIGTQEVIIDAGNGKVLYQGARDAGDNDQDNEMNDD
ncbi:PepSY domain-containing protein [Deinococcus marmoris]|uniref:Propeptide, PepSY amd peptidase M4 n=1 Tax=Deinococcus marmoris TaxID=249408 RepID=A0A1U7P362_9DEIO|nr:PepSY domain-containing protein [Deinococcus marmoris]OLV19600.1 Propeptide, PepSY amd peptidase M4 precursor [Deinococcus marmoris]